MTQDNSEHPLRDGLSQAEPDVSALRASIPDADIDAAVDAIVAAYHPKMEGIVHQYCDEAYTAILESMTDYLRDNASYNFKARIDAIERDARNLRACLRAAKDGKDMIEVRENVYAGAGGFWSESLADIYRAAALDRAKAFEAEEAP